MWVAERCTRLTTMVHDRLGVSDVFRRCVRYESTLEREHELFGGRIVESVEASEVIWGVDKDLVNAGAVSGDVHRAFMVDGETVVAVKGRVQVGDDSHRPRAGLVDGF